MKKSLLLILFCLTIIAIQAQHTLPTEKDKYEEIVKKVKVYPNPAKEYVTFKFNQSFTGSIEIFNRYGVLKKVVNLYEELEKQIDIADFSADQYLYNITINQQSITTGIIIKK